MRAARNQYDLQNQANGGWNALSTAHRTLPIAFMFATALSGCVLAPQGTGDEHAKLNAAAPPF
jgi:hypothetical protein